MLEMKISYKILGYSLYLYKDYQEKLCKTVT